MRLDSRLARAKLVSRGENTGGAERDLLVGWSVKNRMGARSQDDKIRGRNIAIPRGDLHFLCQEPV